MRIGYARVSTEDQKLDLQRDALRKAGCDRIYQEKRSGATDHRPALERALAALKSGDVLVVWKLDRLGRSLQDLISILAQLDAQGVGFCSLSDGIDTTTRRANCCFTSPVRLQISSVRWSRNGPGQACNRRGATGESSGVHRS